MRPLLLKWAQVSKPFWVMGPLKKLNCFLTVVFSLCDIWYSLSLAVSQINAHADNILKSVLGKTIYFAQSVRQKLRVLGRPPTVATTLLADLFWIRWGDILRNSWNYLSMLMALMQWLFKKKFSINFCTVKTAVQRKAITLPFANWSSRYEWL